MRIGIIIIILHFINCNINPVQAQRSNQWMLGWIGKMDFNSGVAQYSLYSDTVHITQTNAGICDTLGEILIWTNGAAIFDSNRDTMPNGSLTHLPFSQNYTLGGMPFYQGSIVIPVPDIQNNFYLFHASLGNYSGTTNDFTLRATLYYSVIDMTLNSGLGEVVLNSQFLEDSIHRGSMIAVKHGNGRDWWLISHEVASTNWFIWLITHQGISLAHKQSIASTTAGTPTYKRSIGQMSFSPDGSLFAYILGFGGGSFRIELMDFDRCTGLFGSVLKTDQPLVSNNPGHLGSQFSPSGRYLYVTATTTLHQYDLWAPDFASSRVLIDTYNGTQAPFSATFSHMKLAPDGKIYCHASNGNWTLHVINNPDYAGIACSFVQNQFWPAAGSRNIISLPNMPNYELGPLVGSPCDTLTDVAEIHSGNAGISIYPNPTDGSFSIQLPSGTTSKTRFELVDLLGRKVYVQEFNNRVVTQIITLPEVVANGVYVGKVVSEKGMVSGKLLLQR
jgi:hypothetical protein